MIGAAELQYAFIFTMAGVIIAMQIAAAVAAVASAGLAIAQAAGAFDSPAPEIETFDPNVEAAAARAKNVLRQQAAFGFQDTRVADLGAGDVNLGTAIQIAPAELRSLE